MAAFKDSTPGSIAMRLRSAQGVRQPGAFRADHQPEAIGKRSVSKLRAGRIERDQRDGRHSKRRQRGPVRIGTWKSAGPAARLERG